MFFTFVQEHETGTAGRPLSGLAKRAIASLPGYQDAFTLPLKQLLNFQKSGQRIRQVIGSFLRSFGSVLQTRSQGTAGMIEVAKFTIPVSGFNDHSEKCEDVFGWCFGGARFIVSLS